jgi:hypothetical protein
MLKNRSRQGAQRYAGKSSQRFNQAALSLSTFFRAISCKSKFPHLGQWA